jgi:hypothetical protein
MLLACRVLVVKLLMTAASKIVFDALIRRKGVPVKIRPPVLENVLVAVRNWDCRLPVISVPPGILIVVLGREQTDSPFVVSEL